MTFFTAFYIFFIRRVRATDNMRKLKILRSEDGASLIMTFFIMVIILAVVLSVSLLLYSEVKVTRNIGISTESLYVAESGIEKIFFYDRQVLPTLAQGQTAVRGLCSMYLPNSKDNPSACPSTSTSGFASSIYCTPASGFTAPVVGTTHNITGCDPSVCDDCKISFSTTLDNNSNKTYVATAQISPQPDGSYTFQIESKGSLGSISRQVEVISNETKHVTPAAITIDHACASPISTAQGSAIFISANITLSVQGTDTIRKATAIIRGPDGSAVDTKDLVLISGSKSGFGTWQLTWTTTAATPTQYYSVDLDVKDSLLTPNEALVTNIPPCSLLP